MSTLTKEATIESGLRILLFLSMDYEYRQTFKLNNVYLTIDQDIFRTEEGTNVR